VSHLSKHHNIRFHNAIFQLLGVEPVFSSSAQKTIAQREKVCMTTFPASIKEWFSIEGVGKLFAENTTPDYLVELDELGEPDEMAQGYIRIASENQAVVVWFARLNGSDDPPVFHDNNQYFDTDFGAIDWQFVSATFTGFIFSMIAGGHFGGWYSGMYLSAEDQAPNFTVFEALRNRYWQGPYAELPDVKIHRFFNRHGIIVIRSIMSQEGVWRAKWILEADSSEALSDLIQSVRHFYTLEQSLKAESCTPESRKHGTLVLEQALSR
jgi:hypothetical protein